MKKLFQSAAVIALSAGMIVGTGVAAASAASYVSVPDRYVYNPYTNVDRALHDYCTMSPDEFTPPPTNADFRGPCARHDLCIMDQQVARSTCDVRFRDDLLNQCEYYYGAWTAWGTACRATALTYYGAVTIATQFS